MFKINLSQISIAGFAAATIALSHFVTQHSHAQGTYNGPVGLWVTAYWKDDSKYPSTYPETARSRANTKVWTLLNDQCRENGTSIINDTVQIADGIAAEIWDGKNTRYQGYADGSGYCYPSR